jgi:hypothetical protein
VIEVHRPGTTRVEQVRAFDPVVAPRVGAHNDRFPATHASRPRRLTNASLRSLLTTPTRWDGPRQTRAAAAFHVTRHSGRGAACAFLRLPLSPQERKRGQRERDFTSKPLGERPRPRCGPWVVEPTNAR